MELTLDRVRRLGGAAGIAFIVIAVICSLPAGHRAQGERGGEDHSLPHRQAREHPGEQLPAGGGLRLLPPVRRGSPRTPRRGCREGVRPGSAALAGGVAAAVLALAGTAVLNGAVFQVAGAGDIRLNQALYDVANDLFIMSGFGFAVFFVGAGLAGASTPALPAALAPAAFVVALLNVASGIGLFAKSGFFAIGGAFGFIVPIASLLWVLAVSVVLLRPTRAS